MGMMMAVSFERYGRLYYLDPGGHEPKIGDKVLVATDGGPEVAECVWAPQWMSEDIGGLPVCAGLAATEDLERDEENRRRRAEGRLAARRLIREHGLPMKLIAVDFLSATNVFVVYFSAPHRVDFRALVRDLAARLRSRVELQQIGPRDEARLQGGIGPCGRDLCCATFLKDFEPVSVRMAKDQDLPGQPDAHRRGVRAADVLPEVRAPALPGLQEEGAAHGNAGRHAGGAGHRRGAQRAFRQRRRADGRRRQHLRLLGGQRLRLAQGLRVDSRHLTQFALSRAGRTADVTARPAPVPLGAIGDAFGGTLPAMDADAPLLRRLRDGDEQAFAALVERYHSSMLRLALSFVSSQAVAEEVVQDTWLAVLRGLDRFEERSSLRTWLFAILVNRARTTGVREARSVPVADAGPVVDASRFGPSGAWVVPPEHWIEEAENRVDAVKLSELLRAGLGGLPARQREVVLLRDVEGLSSAEVCDVLAISEANQRVLLHRGRSKLRSVLESELGGGPR